MHYEFGSVGTFLLGTLPNFLAATAITSAIFNLIDNVGVFSTVTKRITFATLTSFVGLTAWEFVQRLMGYPIDPYDIAMSALGATLIGMLIAILLRKTQIRTYPCQMPNPIN